MRICKTLSVSALLTITPALIGLALFSNEVFAADSYVDNINLTIPVSCSIDGTINTEHTATLQNGTYSASTGSDYENGIGKTTLTVFCNDNNGFSVYAIGYTGDTDSGDNINKLVGQNTGSTINTKVYSSGDTTSNWSMKVNKVTDSTISYLPNNMTITNSYDNWHIVPNTYEQVLTYKAETGSSATDATLGAKLETTYAAYISSTQPADTYQGKVKYVLVNPYNAAEPVSGNQIGVVYDGNGLTFANDATKNRVLYGNVCTPMYIATTPEVVETSNLTNGVQDGSYASDEYILQTKSFSGASKVKVVVDYGLTAGGAGITVAEGNWGGWGDSEPTGAYYDIWDGDNNITGTETYIFNSDSATIETYSYGEPISGYDYGMYARFYPIYDTEETDTEETSVCQIDSTPVSGTYAETTIWNGKWYAVINGEVIWFESQSEVMRYLIKNSTSLLGTTIRLYAYNPYRIVYDGNGATAGTMSGFYTTLITNTSLGSADLMAYNFKKTGYGFAGWSADPNATVNSNSKIYGPNEMITGDELTFDSDTRQITLYAVWVPTSGDMQSFSCSSLNSGRVTALTDNRDGNVYTVGRMQDGNCWMMENLRLDNTATTLSSDNTNNPKPTFTALSATSDDGFVGTGWSWEDRSVLNTNNTNIGGTNASNVALVVSPGLWNVYDWNQTQVDEGNNDHVQWYGYGNYYNWYSATAGNGTYSSGSGAVAAGDICPNSWHLPNGGNGTGVNGGATSGGFSYLDVQLGGTGDRQESATALNRWHSYPNNFLYSGGFNRFSVYGRGDSGVYWSRSASSNSNSYTLNLYSVGLSPSDFSDKYQGGSVRCLINP